MRVKAKPLKLVELKSIIGRLGYCNGMVRLPILVQKRNSNKKLHSLGPF